MDGRYFDTLVRTLARSTPTRRALVLRLGAGALGGILARLGLASPVTAGITHLAHHVQYERIRTATRDRLVPAVFEAAWETGRGLPLAAVLAEAIPTGTTADHLWLA